MALVVVHNLGCDINQETRWVIVLLKLNTYLCNGENHLVTDNNTDIDMTIMSIIWCWNICICICQLLHPSINDYIPNIVQGICALMIYSLCNQSLPLIYSYSFINIQITSLIYCYKFLIIEFNTKIAQDKSIPLAIFGQ